LSGTERDYIGAPIAPAIAYPNLVEGRKFPRQERAEARYSEREQPS